LTKYNNASEKFHEVSALKSCDDKQAADEYRFLV
jgi:hypothetical protein